MGDITLFKNGLPAYLQGAKDDITSALAGDMGMRRISIRAGAFREMVGGKEYAVSKERSMNIVIIRAAPAISRTYYEGTYQEGDNKPPVCWSADGVRPDPQCKTPQAAKCDNTCPFNVKGSGQGDSRACRFSQRVAVLVEGRIEDEEVFQLQLPAKSIFGDGTPDKMPLQAYAKFLQKHGAPIIGVVTEMTFDLNATAPTLTFRPIRPVTAEEYEVIQRLKDSQAAIDAVAYTVYQADNGKDAEEEVAQPAPVQKPKAPKPAPAPAPAPVVEEEDADEEEDEGLSEDDALQRALELVKAQAKAKAAAKAKAKTPAPAPVADAEEEEEIPPPKKASPAKPKPAAEAPSLQSLADEWDD